MLHAGDELTVPGAKLVDIHGAGHISNIEQPAAFTAAVRDFLKADLHPATQHRLGRCKVPGGDIPQSNDLRASSRLAGGWTDGRSAPAQ